MINNDVLRRLRYALDINDAKLIELFKLADYEIAKAELGAIFKKEDEAGYAECGDELMARFLEGLVISRRGRKEDGPSTSPASCPRQTQAPGLRLTNNDILWSIRIALELKDEDIIALMALARVELSKSELSALFRKQGHPNFRPCGDQFLRNFLVGLTAKSRP